MYQREKMYIFVNFLKIDVKPPFHNFLQNLSDILPTKYLIKENFLRARWVEVIFVRLETWNVNL